MALIDIVRWFSKNTQETGLSQTIPEETTLHPSEVPTEGRVVEELDVDEPERPEEQTWKKYSRKRIFGLENEYGIGSPLDDLPGFIRNGGRLYPDCGHAEYCTPETRTPMECVLWDKAGERIVQEFTDRVVKNNTDAFGRTFGTHENYYTFAQWDNLVDTLPFFATRMIFAGSGKVVSETDFRITQRGRYMQLDQSGVTTGNRALINSYKDEDLPWKRFHQILGDANMSEVAGFLKLGTTALVIDLAEDKKLPEIFKAESFIPDYHLLDKDIRHKIRAIPGSPSAIDVQRQYLDAAGTQYSGRDDETDLILQMWGDTLDALEEDPMSLVGTLDWVTKKALIDQALAKNPNNPFKTATNIDLQYHFVKPREEGLFYALQDKGVMQRLFTDEQISDAMTTPPQDTRARIRGLTVEQGFSGRYWTWVQVGAKICNGCGKRHIGGREVSIEDPWNTYEHLRKEVMK